MPNGLTRAQIRSLIYGSISQVEGSGDFAASDINGFIDKGIRFLAPYLKWPRTRDSITPVLGQATYAMSLLTKTYVCLLNAYFGDTSIQGDIQPLDIYTEETLTSIQPKWLDANSNVRDRPRRIIEIDKSNFVIHPTPDAASVASGKQLLISYVYLPDPLASDSSIPDLPATFHDFLVDYGQYECFNGKLNKTDDADKILNRLMARCKTVAPLLTREVDIQAMTFGKYADDMEEEGGWGINFY